MKDRGKSLLLRTRDKDNSCGSLDMGTKSGVFVRHAGLYYERYTRSCVGYTQEKVKCIVLARIYKRIYGI